MIWMAVIAAGYLGWRFWRTWTGDDTVWWFTKPIPIATMISAMGWSIGELDDFFDGLEQIGFDVSEAESGFFRGMIFGATIIAMFDSMIEVINTILREVFFLPELTISSSDVTFDPFSNLPWPWNWIVPKILDIIWFIIADVIASGGPIGHLAYMLGSYIAGGLLQNIFGIVLNKIYTKH